MSNKTCGIRCKEHDMPCHVAYLPKGMGKNAGGIPIADASVEHNHSHVIQINNDSFLIHSWGDGGDRHFHALKGFKQVKEITKKEAVKLQEGEQ